MNPCRSIGKGCFPRVGLFPLTPSEGIGVVLRHTHDLDQSTLSHTQAVSCDKKEARRLERIT